ncbi:DNA pilot protein [Microvirus mar45]|uniref:DNA pilot protein n=1 Tax=Microvirus mar45 TaxID=2851180 RepID=A0A8F6AIX6_9VIRU|nr:DNA pilot protein [Microvirus mar45]
MMSLGLLLGSTAASVGSQILGGTAGKILGGIGSFLGMGAQQQNEREMMALQHQYNEEMAQANQQRNKELWDYTNYENQVQHMKNAGLSVGLMYGKGGAGGVSAAGAQGSGVTNPGTQAIAMGLQMRQIEAQTKLAEAQAKKAEAEAEKTKGVDTELANIEKDIRLGEVQITAANITKAAAEAQIAMENFNQEMINTEIAKETKEARIGEVFAEWALTRAEGTMKIAQKNLTEQQAAKVKKEIEYFAYEIATRRMSAEAAQEAAAAATQKIAKEYEIAGQKLDLEETKMIGDWIAAGVGTLADLVKSFSPKRIISAVDEIFTESGKRTVSSTTTKTGK